MNPAATGILQQPFVQVALPIIVALMLAAWLQNKRFEDMNRRLDEFRQDVNRCFEEVIQRLDRIVAKVENHGERITHLEERTSLIR